MTIAETTQMHKAVLSTWNCEIAKFVDDFYLTGEVTGTF